MTIIEALEIVLAASSEDGARHELYEAHKVLTAQVRHLRNKEEGTLPEEPSEVQEYQEHHIANFKDVGVAFNDTRVWVCVEGKSVFRAKVVDDQLLTEFHSVGDHTKWNEEELGSPQRDTLSKLKEAIRGCKLRDREIAVECNRRDREIAVLTRKIKRLER